MSYNYFWAHYVFQTNSSRKLICLVKLIYELRPIILSIHTRSLPTVQIQPDRQTINQGTNAELLCRVSGDPPPVVTWEKVCVCPEVE